MACALLTPDAMNERDMTPDELERFESRELHHDDERDAGSGPASDAQVRDEQEDAEPGPLPPNPD
jgi:hypothetical protein